MDMESEEKYNWSIIQIKEERLDVKSVPEFRELLAPYITDGSRVILNLSNIQFIDSTGIGALLQFMKALDQIGGVLKLYGIQDQVDAMFKLVHMQNLFVICSSLEEATGVG